MNAETAVKTTANAARTAGTTAKAAAVTPEKDAVMTAEVIAAVPAEVVMIAGGGCEYREERRECREERSCQ